MQLSIFSAEEHPAKTRASDTQPGPGAPGTAWMARVLASRFLSPELWADLNRNGSSGKMFQMSWRHGIPADFSALPQTLPNSGIMSPGVCWISDGLGNPTSHARACSWSEIAMNDAPPRYYLSQRALEGIARRARKPRLFSLRAGAWLSTIERHAFWTKAARASRLR